MYRALVAARAQRTAARSVKYLQADASKGSGHRAPLRSGACHHHRLRVDAADPPARTTRQART